MQPERQKGQGAGQTAKTKRHRKTTATTIHTRPSSVKCGPVAKKRFRQKNSAIFKCALSYHFRRVNIKLRMRSLFFVLIDRYGSRSDASYSVLMSSASLLLLLLLLVSFAPLSGAADEDDASFRLFCRPSTTTRVQPLPHARLPSPAVLPELLREQANKTKKHKQKVCGSRVQLPLRLYAWIIVKRRRNNSNNNNSANKYKERTNGRQVEDLSALFIRTINYPLRLNEREREKKKRGRAGEPVKRP